MPNRALTEHEKKSMRRQLGEIYSRPQAVIENHGFLGHAKTGHVNVDDAQLLNNVIQKYGKRGDTTFDSQKDQDDAIAEILKAKMANIVRFSSDAKQGEKKAYYVTMMDDDYKPRIIGHGFVRRTNNAETGVAEPVQRISTNAAGIVIQKDRNSPDGWKLLTAFPLSRMDMAMSEYEREDVKIKTDPDFDMEPILHKTETYKNGTPIQRTLLDYVNIDRKHMTTIPVQYKPWASRSEEHIRILTRDRKPGIRITGDTELAVTISESENIRTTTIMRDTARHLANALQEQVNQVRAIEIQKNIRSKGIPEINDPKQTHDNTPSPN